MPVIPAPRKQSRRIRNSRPSLITQQVCGQTRIHETSQRRGGYGRQREREGEKEITEG